MKGLSDAWWDKGLGKRTRAWQVHWEIFSLYSSGVQRYPELAELSPCSLSPALFYCCFSDLCEVLVLHMWSETELFIPCVYCHKLSIGCVKKCFPLFALRFIYFWFIPQILSHCWLFFLFAKKDMIVYLILHQLGLFTSWRVPASIQILTWQLLCLWHSWPLSLCLHLSILLYSFVRPELGAGTSCWNCAFLQ